MPSISWFSIKPISLSQDHKLTISYGLDGDELSCTRVDIRSFYNGFPTRNGVNLKRWELLQLGRYLSDLKLGSDVKEDVADELIMGLLPTGDIQLVKRYSKLKLDSSVISVLINVIPGVCMMLELIRDPIQRHTEKILQDIFIYAHVIDNSERSINEIWKEEDEIISKDVTTPAVIYDLTDWQTVYDRYQTLFAGIESLSAKKEDFMDKLSGSYTKNLQDMTKDNAQTLRSLTLFIKKLL